MSRVKEMFDAQLVLLKRFDAIERVTVGLGDISYPLDLETYAGQSRVREFVGRTSEEIAEILVAPTEENELEEVADVLHFLINIFLIIGVTPEQVAQHCGDPTHDSLYCTFSLARDRHQDRTDGGEWNWDRFLVSLNLWTTEHLKSKPWKSNPKPSNVEGFKSISRAIFLSFCACCYYNGISDQELYVAYFSKHSTNLTRLQPN